ncbi:MAG: hypothetical protein JPMHGGIA_02818 [Saprospiraceae bacterium]|nr:hypothetical protein [Saprospiraceae bacterium]
MRCSGSNCLVVGQCPRTASCQRASGVAPCIGGIARAVDGDVVVKSGAVLQVVRSRSRSVIVDQHLIAHFVHATSQISHTNNRFADRDVRQVCTSFILVFRLAVVVGVDAGLVVQTFSGCRISGCSLSTLAVHIVSAASCTQVQGHFDLHRVGVRCTRSNCLVVGQCPRAASCQRASGVAPCIGGIARAVDGDVVVKTWAVLQVVRSRSRSVIVDQHLVAHFVHIAAQISHTNNRFADRDVRQVCTSFILVFRLSVVVGVNTGLIVKTFPGLWFSGRSFSALAVHVVAAASRTQIQGGFYFYGIGVRSTGSNHLVVRQSPRSTANQGSSGIGRSS